MKYGEMARLSELAEATIEGLEAEGIRLTAKEIVSINAVCHAVEHPGSRLELARGRPAHLGGVTLWPLTMYAADWYERVSPLFKSDKGALYALAFAMAHGRDGLDFPDSEAYKRVHQWIRTLRCRAAEIEAACENLIRQDMLPDTGGTMPESDRPTFGDLSMELSALVGGDPEHWERHVTMSYAFELVRTIRAQNDADGKSSAGDPKLRANKALAEICYRIRKRHAKEQDGE